MLRGATWSAAAIVGTAVFRIVVSSDSIKNATAISHGNSRVLEADGRGCGDGSGAVQAVFALVLSGCMGLSDTHI
jgi:hypothetical protein